jgi:glycosyltransferase involved in cell wall biosynthesis
MKILIVNNSKIPATKYGGTERVIWGLGKALHQLGHEVSFLVSKGSYCNFAKNVFIYNTEIDLNLQIPDDIDIVHLNFQPQQHIIKPYVTTFHGNVNEVFTFDNNTIFISANQAKRFHGETFVHNGLAWDDYLKPNLEQKRLFLHFLGDAAWKVKNVRGAIKIATKAKEKLIVMGGSRLNLNMGFRFTPNTNIKFKGKVDNVEKTKLITQSKGLVFPVLWHEPFGLAIIESLFFGSPVFGTSYGSLPELINNDVGALSNSINSLALEAKEAGRFNAQLCNAYARDCFNATVMAKKYLELYLKVLNNNPIHIQAPHFTSADVLPIKRFKMQP